MKAIVFGGSGFLGSHVADALTNAGHKTVIFDVKESPYLQKGQEMVVGNILDNGKNPLEFLMFAHWRLCYEKDLLYGCFKKFALYHLVRETR